MSLLWCFFTRGATATSQHVMSDQEKTISHTRLISKPEHLSLFMRSSATHSAHGKQVHFRMCSHTRAAWVLLWIRTTLFALAALYLHTEASAWISYLQTSGYSPTLGAKQRRLIIRGALGWIGPTAEPRCSKRG